ncbi:hypothetical protein CAPTEDRAFT_203075 [Capitella teleta]|uniref:Uncharacterized protein n=1 Tax=Capitella teleta TaxID=283909 RepID=R7TCW0_CAPTE|nr:hypothetical protein CAPTEDRAFT_203075 [Capitella teleta]|eukprot:ELT88911.1 hypothetical protein CAPTEDRAFT_203075 [Capitella teleta]
MVELEMELEYQKKKGCFWGETTSSSSLFRGLAIRGHEESEGNLRQLLLLRRQDVKPLQQWLHEGSYMSPDILNEYIQLLGHSVLRNILENIRDAKHFAVMADETKDSGHQE